MSESRWPDDRASFEAYWERALRDVHMDDVTRTYLRGSRVAGVPARAARPTLGPSHRFLTVGLSSALRFAKSLGLPWSPHDQTRFER